MSIQLDASDALARGFAKHLAAIAKRSGAPAEVVSPLEHAAYRVSLACSAGSVCVPLGDLLHGGKAELETPLEPRLQASLEPSLAPPLEAKWRSDLEALREALFASTMLSTSHDPVRPLVIDEQDRLYLNRYFDYEERLARRLLQTYTGPKQAIDQSLKDFFQRLFPQQPKAGDAKPDWQALAVALAINRGFTLISGGPGTGKTTSVLKLIICAKYMDPQCRIRLAAPTGKAASRMLEALSKAAEDIGQTTERSTVAEGIRTTLELPKEAFTVHRLLGASSHADRFHYDRDHPLPLDLLIVDEASMLDLALTVQLIEAVPSTARIVFLGDKDQLAAVEAGAVFAELSASPSLSIACCEQLEQITGISATSYQHESPPDGLLDNVIWLRHNYRFAKHSDIDDLIGLINQGDAKTLIARLKSGSYQNINWHDDTLPALSGYAKALLLEPMADYIKQLDTDRQDLFSLFDRLGRYKILCAERDGPRGVEAMNQLVNEAVQMEQRARGHAKRERFVDDAAHRTWYPGQCIMVLRNDYHLGRFNGDIGIVMANTQGHPVVYFPDALEPDKAISLSRLSDYELSFALTVHKAQGSEFDHICLVLPNKTSPVVNKSLLYTAISRAKKSVSIIASEASLFEAIARPVKRYSGIRSRIAALTS
ncbi:MAG: exodeoxyribonuclease V subunit alpha [Burkholderiaceae bacterium]